MSIAADDLTDTTQKWEQIALPATLSLPYKIRIEKEEFLNLITDEMDYLIYTYLDIEGLLPPLTQGFQYKDSDRMTFDIPGENLD